MVVMKMNVKSSQSQFHAQRIQIVEQTFIQATLVKMRMLLEKRGNKHYLEFK